MIIMRTELEKAKHNAYMREYYKHTKKVQEIKNKLLEKLYNIFKKNAEMIAPNLDENELEILKEVDKLVN